MRIFAALLFAVLFCFDAIATHYDLYLLAGQSNMDGRGRAEALPADQRDSFSDAIIYYRSVPIASDGWQPLATGFSIPPKYKGELPSHTFGPEIGFVHAMLPVMGGASGSDPKLGIIKGSKGGTSLREDWAPGTHGDLKSQGPRYRDFIETIRLATTELEQRGDSWSLKGLLWHQGESDSKSSAERHEERLLRLVARLREDLDLDGLPVVVGQVFDNGKRDGVRQAIQRVGKSSPTVGLVMVDGLTTWDEGTHFDAASQLEMGKRFAEQMLAIQSRQNKQASQDKQAAQSLPKVVCFGDSITNRGYPGILSGILGVDAMNAGVGGNSTSDAMRRLAKDVLSRKPDVTVIFFGTNDIRVDNQKKHVPISKYRENLVAMIQACREGGSEVVLCTLPPIDPVPYFTRHDRSVFDSAGGLAKLIRDYHQAALEIAEASNVSLVDLNVLLSQDPTWLSRDGVHPSDAGNQIIAKHIAAAIGPLLKVQTQKEPSDDQLGPSDDQRGTSNDQRGTSNE